MNIGERQIVEVEGLAPPGTSYSHGVVGDGRFLYVAGQVGLGSDRVLIGDDAESQARQAFANVRAVLAGAGCDFSSVVKLTTYLTDRADYPAVAKARADFITAPFPASTAIVVAGLPDPRYLVEIDAVAVVPR